MPCASIRREVVSAEARLKCLGGTDGRSPGRSVGSLGGSRWIAVRGLVIRPRRSPTLRIRPTQPQNQPGRTQPGAVPPVLTVRYDCRLPHRPPAGGAGAGGGGGKAPSACRRRLAPPRPTP